MIFIPSSMLAGSVDDIVTKVNFALDLPDRTRADFQAWAPQGTHQAECVNLRNLVIEESKSYDFGEVRDFYGDVDDLQLYVFLPPIAVSALLTVVAGCLGFSNKAGTVSAGVVWVLLSIILGALSALAVAVNTVCSDYIKVDQLPDDFKWFIDPTAENSETRQFLDLSLVNALLEACNAPPNVAKYFNAGILQPDYLSVRHELCHDIYGSVIISTTLLAFALAAWILFGLFQVVTFDTIVTKGLARLFK